MFRLYCKNPKIDQLFEVANDNTLMKIWPLYEGKDEVHIWLENCDGYSKKET